MIIFPLQVNFSELSRKYGAADKTKVGNTLVSATTLKEKGGACLHKLFQGLWTGLCDAQQGVWIMLSRFDITITGVLTWRCVERSLQTFVCQQW